jgi:ketosteroid isomerase-like protein
MEETPLETQTSNAGNQPQDAEGAVRSELQAAYARAGKAYREKDADALMGMVTPDFTQQMPDGQTISYDEIEPALRQWLDTVEAVTSYKIDIEELTVLGEEAVARVREHVSTTFTDPHNLRHRGDQANISRVTWRKTADGWRIRQTEYLTGQTLVDGNPI